MPALRIEPLSRHIDRSQFSCGQPSLDAYIKQRAAQDQRRNVATVFAMVDPDDDQRIAGYYTLSACAIRLNDIPDDLRIHLPRYAEIPAVLLGRLAVDRGYQGKDVGKGLIMDALERIHRERQHVAIWAVIVDAIDEDARAFYERFDFERFPDNPHRLFLRTSTIDTMVREWVRAHSYAHGLTAVESAGATSGTSRMAIRK